MKKSVSRTMAMAWQLHDSWHTGSLRQQQFQFPR